MSFPSLTGCYCLVAAVLLGCSTGEESSRTGEREPLDVPDDAAGGAADSGNEQPGGTPSSGGTLSGGTLPDEVDGGIGGRAGVLPSDFEPLNLTFRYLESNPRAAEDPPGCSLYDTSQGFREYFNSKREQMDLVAQLFNRIMGVQGRSPDVMMEVRAFDFDDAQIDRESCIEVSSPGVNSRGTAYGDILSEGNIFIDFEPGPARERVVNLLAHEVLHGLSLGHDPDDDGLMAPFITGDDQFLDAFILDGLRSVNVELVDDLPDRISAGERIYINELLETYLGVRIL